MHILEGHLGAIIAALGRQVSEGDGVYGAILLHTAILNEA